MHHTLTFRNLMFVLLLIGINSACNDEKTTGTDFDRAGMLTTYADQLIIPAFTDLQLKVTALQTSWASFESNLDTSALKQVQNAWEAAFLSWQHANAYNFGPAGEAGLNKSLVEEIGVFPSNVTQIEDYISAQDFTLNNANRDTRGFLALDYLLYFQSDKLRNDAARRAYTGAVIQHLKQRIDQVVSGWSTYRATFLASTGTEAGGSTSLLYNAFVQSYESIKNYKVGLPAGKRPGQTAPEPSLVEAYYSGLSFKALQAHLETINAIYNGQTGTSVVHPGFKSYVNSVVGGPTLVAATEAQWLQVKVALSLVPNKPVLSELMAAGDTNVDALHTELQKQTRFFKSDMSSLLGIAITFSSGDGD